MKHFLKKGIALSVALAVCLALAACGGSAGGGASSPNASFAEASWQSYDGYGVALEHPSGWSLYSFAEEDAALLRSVLMISGAQDIYIRAYVDMLGELHTVLSPSDNAEAEMFFERLKESAAVSPSFPAQPNYYNDDEALAYLDAIEAMREAPANPLPEFGGELPGKTVSFETTRLDDDGSLAYARDAQSGLYGYIDRTGEWVIEPQFESAGAFSEGLALVLAHGESGYKYIDRSGAVIIEGAREGESVLKIAMGSYTKPFSDGLAAVHIDNGYTQDQLYIDREGNIVVDAEFVPKLENTSYGNEFCFDIATPYRGGLAAVMRSKNSGANDFISLYESAYIIGTEGRVVATVPEHCAVDTDGFDGNMLLGITPEKSYIGSELVGLCDAEGNIAVPCEYYDLKYGENGLYAAKKDGKWGFIDRSGSTVIDFMYEEACAFSDGLAAVCRDGRWGFIDESGGYVIEPMFDGVCPLNRRLGSDLWGAAFSCGVAAVRIGDYWGLVDMVGLPIVDFTFKSVSNSPDGCPFTSCSRDTICYSDGELSGLLSLDGKIACEPKFESISSFYSTD